MPCYWPSLWAPNSSAASSSRSGANSLKASWTIFRTWQSCPTALHSKAPSLLARMPAMASRSSAFTRSVLEGGTIDSMKTAARKKATPAQVRLFVPTPAKHQPREMPTCPEHTMRCTVSAFSTCWIGPCSQPAWSASPWWPFACSAPTALAPPLHSHELASTSDSKSASWVWRRMLEALGIVTPAATAVNQSACSANLSRAAAAGSLFAAASQCKDGSPNCGRTLNCSNAKKKSCTEASPLIEPLLGPATAPARIFCYAGKHFRQRQRHAGISTEICAVSMHSSVAATWSAGPPASNCATPKFLEELALASCWKCLENSRSSSCCCVGAAPGHRSPQHLGFAHEDFLCT